MTKKQLNDLDMLYCEIVECVLALHQIFDSDLDDERAKSYIDSALHSLSDAASHLVVFLMPYDDDESL